MPEDEQGSVCEGGPYIEERTPLQVAFHGYMCEQAKTPPQPKAPGDGRATRKPQSENKGKWGSHENVRERPADRDKENWKKWKKKRG